VNSSPNSSDTVLGKSPFRNSIVKHRQLAVEQIEPLMVGSGENTAYSGRSRSAFRGDVDHDSGLKPISVPG
jgi:hypothetical protein